MRATKTAAPRIAIVYDRFNTTFGGAEQVLIALQQLYPQADFFTAVYDPRQATWAQNWRVQASFLRYLPWSQHLHRYLAWLMPLAFEGLDLSSYQIIISITSAEAKSVITRADQLHLCYLLSPPRYLYHYQQQYLEQHPLLRWPLLKQCAQVLLRYLHHYDQQAIMRPDLIVPIAQAVARRVKEYYQLESAAPIYPPVDSSLLQQPAPQSPPANHQPFHLIVSRLVPYKRVDWAIRACAALGERLIIVGTGPELGRLRRLARQLAPQLIEFRSRQSAAELATLYRQCDTLLSPGLDDFGIVAMEANLFGKPVLINQLAGAAELIRDGVHGLHLDYQEQEPVTSGVEKLITALRRRKTLAFNSQLLTKNARAYDTTVFCAKFAKMVDEAYKHQQKAQL